MSDYSHPNLLSENNIAYLNKDSENKNFALNNLNEQMDRLITDLAADDNSNIQNKEDILEQIDDLQTTKESYYDEINSSTTLFSDFANSTNTNKINQEANLKIVNEELNKTNVRNEYYSDKIKNNIRNIQINTFYQKKYQSQINILKFIILVCIVIISLSFIKKKGFISQIMYLLIIGIIIAASIIRICYMLYDIIIRDKNIFEEIDNSWVLSVFDSTRKQDGDDYDDDDQCPV
tara:strand:+ start:205 stop:906 length:702 start_codon:yes stop_codon:yes gene_type:complete